MMKFPEKKIGAADTATLNRWYHQESSLSNREDSEKMRYPTMEQVEKADHLTLGRWFRFLPSPGASAVWKSRKEFGKVMKKQKPILEKVIERFNEKGGFTPAISKALGE